MITLTVYGDLHGKGRPRFANGHAYTPESTRRYEAEIQAAWMLAGGRMQEGAVAVDITAYQALPKRATKAQQHAAARGEIWPIRKPDIDNIIKIVLDALNGYAYRDDTQVVMLDARKEYATDGVSRLVVKVNSVSQETGAEVDSNVAQDGRRKG